MLPPDPLEHGGLAAFATRFRAGAVTAEQVTSAYLARIAALEPKLGAYEYVAADQALAAARDIDRRLKAGEDLGPLMGAPVAIKDLLAVDGMPTTAGSRIDVADAIGDEGSFVKMLKHAGCVILGKVKTTEFALGTLLGVNQVRGTPWNPWDAKEKRIPGGSSSGPGVAMAAGLCAFAIGSDTGGSVRFPAAFCGVFGLKTTKGLWPTDGVFPLSPTFDTLGLLTRSAADAAVIYGALQGEVAAQPASPRGLRLGRPSTYFFDQLEPAVARCLDAAIERFAGAGVDIVACDFPEIGEAEEIYLPVTTTEILTVLGRERFLRERHKMDPVGEARVRQSLDITADRYIQMAWRQKKLVEIAHDRMRSLNLDGWLAPAATILPITVKYAMTPEGTHILQKIAGRTARATNLFGMCSTTTPVQMLAGAALPVGFQVNCAGFADAKALSIARLLEDLIGAPPRPELSAFL